MELINTGTREYHLRNRNATQSIYAQRNVGFDTPRTLTVAHSYSKNGKTRNTAIILKDVVRNATNELGSNQVMLKLSTDVKVVTEEQVKSVLGELIFAVIPWTYIDNLISTTGNPIEANLEQDWRVAVLGTSPSITPRAAIDVNAILNEEH